MIGRKVCTCQIFFKDPSVGPVWLDLGFQVEGVEYDKYGTCTKRGEIARSCLLDMKGNDWARIDLYEYGGKSPSLEEAKGDYICTQIA